MKTTGVIVTYNEKNTIVKKLKSLIMQTKQLDQIVLVDNHSTDHTLEVAEGFLHKQKIDFRMIRISEKLTKEECYQMAMELAKNELVILAKNEWKVDFVEKIVALDKEIVVEGKKPEYFGMELVENSYQEDAIVAMKKGTVINNVEKTIIQAYVQGQLGMIEGKEHTSKVADLTSRYNALQDLVMECKNEGIDTNELESQLGFYINTKSKNSSFKTKFASLKNGDYKKYGSGLKSFLADLK